MDKRKPGDTCPMHGNNCYFALCFIKNRCANPGSLMQPVWSGSTPAHSLPDVPLSPAQAASEARKNEPMATGCLDYFPDALAAVAKLSKRGNDKHNPGQPLHWSREKSSDHADCIMRHLRDRGTWDTDNDCLHDVAVAWRALAQAQLAIEKYNASLKR